MITVIHSETAARVDEFAKVNTPDNSRPSSVENVQQMNIPTTNCAVENTASSTAITTPQETPPVQMSNQISRPSSSPGIYSVLNNSNKLFIKNKQKNK